MDNYWEVKLLGVTFAHGPKETLPNEYQRRELRSAGYKIYVEGKVYKN